MEKAQKPKELALCRKNGEQRQREREREKMIHLMFKFFFQAAYKKAKVLMNKFPEQFFTIRCEYLKDRRAMFRS